MRYDAIIIGGGAAGLFCAITAAKRGRKVLVIEHNAEVGRKIIISGGGRCNFTNIDVGPENFISQNPHFCKSALAGFTPNDFLDIVRRHRIPFYKKTLGQLFCRESSRAIVDMLLAECRRAKVEIATSCSVDSVKHEDNTFLIETSRGLIRSHKLVVACGGLSFAKVGATDLGYRLASQFGLRIVDTRPSLVAMVMSGGGYSALAGVSVDSVAAAETQSFRENILFTHRGLSGPAILQISNYWRPGQPVNIDLLPDISVAEILRANRRLNKTTAGLIGEYLPKRIAAKLLPDEISDKFISKLTDREIDEVSTQLNAWQVRFDRTEGYDRAEVTLGGVSTVELSSKTMETHTITGLYFIGEVVDVTGWLGGYNFQWAWASGFAAGNSI